MNDWESGLTEMKAKLVHLRVLRADYQEYRDLYEAIKENQVLELSPNYEIVIRNLVQAGVDARTRYIEKLADVFGPFDEELVALIVP